MRKRFKSLFDPNQSVLLFVIGTATLTIALQALYDTAKQTARDRSLPEMLGAWLLAIGMMVVSLSVIVIPQLRRPRTLGTVNISEYKRPDPHAGLVLLASPQAGTAPAAIRFHKSTLKVCWFIASKDSLASAKSLAEQFQQECPQVKFIVPGEQDLIDPDQVADTYQRVVYIGTIGCSQFNLTKQDLIADITGGLKPMTAGMSNACLATGMDMQYMKAARKENGEPDRSTSASPILIDQEFVPLRATS